MGGPLVSCLTATHGRFRVLQEAIACFLLQDHANKELIILNNHPVPLYVNLPQVTVLNEPGYPTLGDCRNRLLREAHGEFVRTWDDDDLYLPWAISQGVAHIGSGNGCKPGRSWMSISNEHYTLGDNVYEASMTLRTDFARKYGYKRSGGDEHDPLFTGINAEGRFNLFPVTPHEASYCYRWGAGLHHASGTLGNGEPEEKRSATWRGANDDHGDGQLLTPADVAHYFNDIKNAAKELYELDNENR